MLVRAMRLEAKGIMSYELVDTLGQALPAIEAGAHVDVHLPNGLIRSYSLAGDPSDRTRWVLGVLRETRGTGGSRAMHEMVRVGAEIAVGPVRNAFALAADAKHSVLLAGGIGITPLKSMAHTLARSGASFELHYCARSADRTAFVPELSALAPVGQLHFHFDQGDPAKGLDIQSLLRTPDEGTHVYFCGPEGFMAACSQASEHWPVGTVHKEYFKAPEQSVPAGVDGEFDVHLARSGQTIRVSPDQTILRAIELTGLRVSTSCLSGLCGSCKVDYVDGEVDHRDYILSADERDRCLTVCVSRAKSKSLTLDI